MSNPPAPPDVPRGPGEEGPAAGAFAADTLGWSMPSSTSPLVTGEVDVATPRGYRPWPLWKWILIGAPPGHWTWDLMRLLIRINIVMGALLGLVLSVSAVFTDVPREMIQFVFGATIACAAAEMAWEGRWFGRADRSPDRGQAVGED